MARLQTLAAQAADAIHDDQALDLERVVLDSQSAQITHQLQQTAAGVAAMRRDMRRQIQEQTHELRVANNSLQALDRQRKAFLAVASHEMRTPLTAVYGFLRLFSTGRLGKLNDDQREIVVTMLANTQRLSHYINDLLDSARVEAGNIQVEPSLVPVREACEAVVRDLSPLLEHRKLTVDVEVPSAARVFADPGLLGQILVNLISNGAKYAPFESSMRLAAEPAGDGWRVSVRDRGPGAPEAICQGLLVRFLQAAVPNDAFQKGTGLGLLISRAFLAAMGGALSVRKPSDGGAEFSFVLPNSDPGLHASAVPLPAMQMAQVFAVRSRA